jgi:L-ascorbate metabolism protein UlaG (beta-lactamase superfamily)
MSQSRFGKQPTGERLARIERSPNYRDGAFQNLLPTPMMNEDASYPGVLRDFLFNRSSRQTPAAPLPSQKIDLSALDPKENVFVWFGHSSFFMQIDGKTILVDPVLCGNASPVSFTNKSYPGSDAYAPADMPAIDLLLLTHDHWDHLDYETLTQLRPRIKHIVTGLGVGSHLEEWGFDRGIIDEKDWNETVDLNGGFRVDVATARHFSGRGFTRNKTLWVSFVLRTPTKNIFISGDGGYGPHFAEIGSKFGPFDLAVIECGQYNEAWKYIHMNPEETVRAARDVRAKAFVPVHWGKFTLAFHAWDESISRVTEESRRLGVRVLHPMIGARMPLTDSTTTSRWWELDARLIEAAAAQ